ncbi:3-phosphoshikimate 1-carboxyvinyltransferase [Ekhidna lutea]|uniref:3-phosphoshikimate 1-carboxyvinyltransferase n=1 Tax=Ekhidna lutea TaxID=447679 RepID=A0A239JJ00_EKHLU|nr:3-phosphoshikimate 1-carboxyvinyltransferase [Ekhidna lutea]SNT05388.1 3-phosphoshikimate 1-carboxyvinyltransferase [Ekhidna lutea]
MKYRLKRYNSRLKGTVTLESSKSESNRALIINALAGGEATRIANLSNARDTQTMLSLLQSRPEVYDVKDAGTTMRFLTAYLAIHGEGETITGSERMKNRPIGPLVDSLRSIGAQIEYLEKDGYPPLRISKIEHQQTNEISIKGNISSQYISALLMIAPQLENGLTINLTTDIYSLPYIQMTLDLMRAFDVESDFEGNTVSVKPQAYEPTKYAIEGDWSGASYWYGFMALSPEKGYLNLPDIRNYSTQGDKEIANIMYQLGITTYFEPGKVKLMKRNERVHCLKIDFRDCPDLAQTVMVAAAASDVKLEMVGLESLKIKETDRIAAMQAELNKIGAQLLENKSEWTLIPSVNLPDEVEIDTYEDHRMAMAFAPLCFLMDVTICDPMVVEKSYPGFWDEVEKIGVKIEKINN